MNAIFRRTLLMAALLSLFNMAVAGDNDLFDIVVTPTHTEEEEQPSIQGEDDHNQEIERGDLLEIQPTTRANMHPEMERELLDIKLPSRGMHKRSVKSEFGEPDYMKPAVGKPPISSWGYENFTIYFESDWVIHSVLNQK